MALEVAPAGAELARALSMYDDLVRAMVDSGGGVAGLRRCYDSWFEQFPVPDDARVVVVDAGGVPALEVTVPEAAGRTRTVVHCHSGGYVLGSARGYRAFGAALSRAAEATVLLVDYRLAPEHPHPAALDDTVAAYHWLLRRGIASSTIVLSGDSAGGGLVVAALVRLAAEAAPLPAAAVAISPFVDLALTGASLQQNPKRDPVCQPEALDYFATLYLGDADPRLPLASPLYADLSGLPPLLLIAGEAETLKDDAVRLAERARLAGVDVELHVADRMPHIFPVFSSFLREGSAAVDRIGRFVRERTS